MRMVFATEKIADASFALLCHFPRVLRRWQRRVKRAPRPRACRPPWSATSESRSLTRRDRPVLLTNNEQQQTPQTSSHPSCVGRSRVLPSETRAPVYASRPTTLLSPSIHVSLPLLGRKRVSMQFRPVDVFLICCSVRTQPLIAMPLRGRMVPLYGQV